MAGRQDDVQSLSNDVRNITAQSDAVSVANSAASGDSSARKVDPEAPTALAEEEPTAVLTVDCPVCLQPCVHPVRLPCSHVFCFLCIKGVASRDRRCALCRSEIPQDFVRRPVLVSKGAADVSGTAAVAAATAIAVLDDTHLDYDGQYRWYYEGGHGWWEYEERTSYEIERYCRRRESNRDSVPATFELLIAGFMYVIDLEHGLQYRRGNPGRRRRIKRDLAGIPDCKGVAGLSCRKRLPERRDGDGTDNNGAHTIAAAGVAVAAASSAAATAATDSAVGGAAAAAAGTDSRVGGVPAASLATASATGGAAAAAVATDSRVGGVPAAALATASATGGAVAAAVAAHSAVDNVLAAATDSAVGGTVLTAVTAGASCRTVTSQATQSSRDTNATTPSRVNIAATPATDSSTPTVNPVETTSTTASLSVGNQVTVVTDQLSGLGVSSVRRAQNQSAHMDNSERETSAQRRRDRQQNRGRPIDDAN